MEFFNNKANDKLKFKLNAEGINTSEIEPRLVFNSKDKMNCIIFGKIKEGICTFDIPELKLYEKNDSGDIKFELVSKDLYFSVWEDKFTIKTKTSIKLDEMVRESVEEERPKIKVSLEAKPIVEKVEEEEPKRVIPSVPKNERSKLNEGVDENETSQLKSFGQFFDKRKH